MTDKPPILDYARPPQRSSLPWQTIAAIPLLLLAPLTECTCSHMTWVSIPFTMSAIGLGWWGFCWKTSSPLWRILMIAVAVLASLEAAKNLADILWFGHHPLLRLVRSDAPRVSWR